MGSEMLSWATYMFALNALPPNPRNISDWKQQWEKRLKEASASWVNKWVAHQTRDDFWKHGSVCEDYDRIKVPVLAIGKQYFKHLFNRLAEGFRPVLYLKVKLN